MGSESNKKLLFTRFKDITKTSQFLVLSFHLLYKQRISSTDGDGGKSGPEKVQDARISVASLYL